MFPASPMEESDTVEKNSDPHGARSGGRRNAELPQEFDVRGCWRAGRPPDLFAREEHGPISNFRFLRDAVGAKMDI